MVLFNVTDFLSEPYDLLSSKMGKEVLRALRAVRLIPVTKRRFNKTVSGRQFHGYEGCSYLKTLIPSVTPQSNPTGDLDTSWPAPRTLPPPHLLLCLSYPPHHSALTPMLALPSGVLPNQPVVGEQFVRPESVMF